MLTPQEVKDFAISLGADRCGISGTGRFSEAPAGFRPTDIWSKAKSVVVFLKSMPKEAIHAENVAVYSHTAYMLYTTLDKIGLELCIRLQHKGHGAIPVPTDVPYLFWEPEKQKGMGILSLRHAARNAGLGFLGRNNLLIDDEFGSMLYIGAVLTDALLEEDPLSTVTECLKGCSLCLDSCPSGALDGITVRQDLCRPLSCQVHPRGWDLYTCNECRKVCPFNN
ncbi:MAG TPA: hypothetical protein VK212_07255 [Lentimicrobium sp.]|nr:hypothetical protein [Lentimicrobium sp.]